MTIINRIPTNLRNVSHLFLWMICNHIHRNNVTFVESVKQKILSSTLSQFEDDVCKYILHIKDNLHLITVNDSSPNDHNDQVIQIFTQLTSSSIKSFADKMKELYVDYLEAKLPNLTPDMLLKAANDKMQVLKHSGQWTDTETPDVMALKLQLETHQAASTDTIKQLVAHIGHLEHCKHGRSLVDAPTHSDKHGKRNQPDYPSHSYPAWMITPPRTNDEVKAVDQRIYTWCPKCR
jgi:hypothetical protein